MDLENVTAELRPRSDWEAADFGVRMIRRDAAAIYRIWFAITLPLLALALLGIAYLPYPFLATFLYWWLEPVADGPILRVIARRLFGENADVRATLRATPQLAWQNRIFLLSPYRFHFARSVAMPVTQLEGLKGEARRARARVLNLKILNHGIGVTTAYEHLVIALYLGIVLIGFALVPTAYQDSLGESWIDVFWFDSTKLASAVSLCVFYVAQSALQPWFVGAGFGLYINCRTQLEAWDIEVAFRRMVQRRAAGAAAIVLLALLVVPAMTPWGTARAEEMPAADGGEPTAVDDGIGGYWTDDDIAPALEAVLASDALTKTREVEEWQLIDQDEPEPEIDDGSSGWWSTMLRNIGRLLAFVVEFGLWIALAFVLLLAFATRKHWLPYLSVPQYEKSVAQRVLLAGGEISADSLPDDVPAAAMRLWNAGDKRAALSLLYRASVFAAVTRHGVRLPASATEGECVRAVTKQVDRDQSDYFGRVVSTWICCAYGFREPADDTMLPLCTEWPRHYGAAG